ncbi:MAG: hypothetical protein ACRDK0_14175 [Solirubrobacteraceae bacterium]
MAKPIDKPTELETDEPFLTIYEEDLEEAANDPRAKAFLQEAYAKFQKMEAEGRIIY